jgi:hypothetical protein
VTKEVVVRVRGLTTSEKRAVTWRMMGMTEEHAPREGPATGLLQGSRAPTTGAEQPGEAGCECRCQMMGLR